MLASSKKTVSCPKNGTSVHVLLSEPVTLSTPIIFVSDRVMVLNFSDLVIAAVLVLTFWGGLFGGGEKAKRHS